MFKPLLATILTGLVVSTVTGLVVSTTLPVNASTVPVQVKFKMTSCASDFDQYRCADILVRIAEDGYLALKSPQQVSYTYSLPYFGSYTSAISDFDHDTFDNIYSFSEVDERHKWATSKRQRVTLNKVCIAEQQCVNANMTSYKAQDDFLTKTLQFNID